jgi:hypothetical protein
MGSGQTETVVAVVAVVATVRADEEDAVEKRLGDATSF